MLVNNDEPSICIQPARPWLRTDAAHLLDLDRTGVAHGFHEFVQVGQIGGGFGIGHVERIARRKALWKVGFPIARIRIPFPFSKRGVQCSESPASTKSIAS